MVVTVLDGTARNLGITHVKALSGSKSPERRRADDDDV